MYYTFAKQTPHVRVRQRVVHDATGSPTTDRSAIAKRSELMADRRLTETQEQRQVADAKLSGQRERVKDSRTGRIREQLERADDRIGVVAAYHLAQERSHVLRMKALDIATLARQFHV